MTIITMNDERIDEIINDPGSATVDDLDLLIEAVADLMDLVYTLEVDKEDLEHEVARLESELHNMEEDAESA